MTVQGLLLLTSGLFCMGIYGLLTRRNAIGVLVAVELMANANWPVLRADDVMYLLNDGQWLAAKEDVGLFLGVDQYVLAIF